MNTVQKDSQARFRSFEEFWPFYVAEHQKDWNRKLHFCGTALLIPLILVGVFVHPLVLLGLPVVGYGFAWIGHFIIEKNRPATFAHPLWSLRGDMRMFRLMILGKMKVEILNLADAGLFGYETAIGQMKISAATPSSKKK